MSRQEFEDDGDWTEKFIQVIQNRPPIFNTGIPEHSDRNLVSRLWEEIYAIMVPCWQEMTTAEKSVKAKELQSKWRNLRTCFRRELNKQKGSSGQAASKRRKYVYFDQLLFLLPTMEDRATVSECRSIQKEDSGSENESEVIPTEDHSQNEDSNKEQQPGPSTQSPQPTSQPGTSTQSHQPTHQPGTSTQSQQPPVARRNIQAKRKTPTYKESLLAILKDKKAEPIDEDQSFLLSLVPAFKKLNDTQKLDAKMEFLSILKRLTQSHQGSFYQTSQGYGNHPSFGYPGTVGNFLSPPNAFRTYNVENYPSHSSTPTPAMSEISRSSASSSCDYRSPPMEVPDFT